MTRLIESFHDYNNGVSSHSKEAIGRIGIVALPHLITGLRHEHHAVRYGWSEALGNLGWQAMKAVPMLKKIAKNDKNPYVRKQAKGAIQMITNDY
ncbi:MAG: HEAT repeat domain-containing protein [Spirochaetota bacterium]|nr:HEAT repeat domain-containing protein [Spirochaetota bacterium]